MLRTGLLTLCGILIPVIAAGQTADYLARQALERRVEALSDPLRADSLAQDAETLMAGLGLTLATPATPVPASPVFEPVGGAVVELVDIRLLLTRIAVQSGAQDHTALIRAQGDRSHDVILLRGGFVSTSDLVNLARDTPAAPFVTETAIGLVLTRPLAIWDDAGLALGAGERLVLDRPSGSFIANLGHMAVAGGAIHGSAGANSAEAAFRPFVLTAGQGSFTAIGARFSALGFDASAVFGGLAVVNSGLVETRLPSVIRDTTFSDVASVALMGTRGAAVVGNRISGSSGSAIIVSDASGALVAGNRFSDLTGAHALRVTGGSFNVEISENLISPGPRIGILIDDESRLVTLSGNVILGAATSGIALRGADCVGISDNLVALNAGTGISLTDTEGSSVSDNAILFNLGSGVLLRDQPLTAVVRVADNVIAGNRDGLRGATPGRVDLFGNRLDGQLPRVFAGDLAPLAVDWLRLRRDPETSKAPAAMPLPCSLGGNG